VTATSGTSSASAKFTVVPSISVTPLSGPANSTVTITGNGFAANSPITITYDSKAILTNPPSIVTANDGTFTATFTVPNSYAGQHNLLAVDSFGNSAATTFLQN
jgi:IPT/TIG domain